MDTPATPSLRKGRGRSDEFAIIVSRKRDLDVLTVQVEAVPETPEDSYDDLKNKAEQEIRSRCEVRPVVEVLPQGTLPRTKFKAKRVKDMRR